MRVEEEESRAAVGDRMNFPFLSAADAVAEGASPKKSAPEIASGPGIETGATRPLREQSPDGLCTREAWAAPCRFRASKFATWFVNGTDKLKRDADAAGPILDFAVVGVPKAGTTTMIANLGKVAPVPAADVCSSVHQIVHYAYKGWSNNNSNTYQHGGSSKLLRGVKCPKIISDTREWSTYLPRTLLIVGIRHPVLWFQSFWNQLISRQRQGKTTMSPYSLVPICTRFCNSFGCKRHKRGPFRPFGVICIARARFHLALAQLGKTALNETERTLLAPTDPDGGDKLANHRTRNPIFLYEQTELSQDYVWADLAKLLRHQGNLSHDRLVRSRGIKESSSAPVKKMQICDPQYEPLRKQLMPYAYEMSIWICRYFVGSEGVHVPSRARFCSLVQDYANDPCGVLVRHVNGSYVRK